MAYLGAIGFTAMACFTLFQLALLFKALYDARKYPECQRAVLHFLAGAFALTLASALWGFCK